MILLIRNQQKWCCKAGYK